MRQAALLAAVLILCSAAGGCRSMDDYWSMSATRWAYGEAGIHRAFSGPVNLGGGGSGEAAVAFLAVYGAILLTPIAIDVVLLPLTLTHDIWLAASGRRRAEPREIPVPVR
ncbi:MAG: hypothetical protein MUC63_07260 [Planctomycetes bacterium]|jgi:hypothetical protein|nr:hypothetical protein [Planctomycetota bacterium]